MQFDLTPPPTTTSTTVSPSKGNVTTIVTSTPNAAAPRALPVSAQWLLSVFTSLVMDLVVSAPFSILVGLVIAAIKTRFALPAEVERRKRIAEHVHVRWSEVEFSASRPDEFASWLRHDLKWQPNFDGAAGVGASIKMAGARTDDDTVGDEAGASKSFAQSAGMALLQVRVSSSSSSSSLHWNYLFFSFF